MESTPEPLHIPTPHTPTQETSRDQKLQIQTLYFTAGWTLADLILHFPRLTRRQIDYAIETRPTPQKPGHCRRHFLITPCHRKQLIDWVTTDSFTRDIPWNELPKYLGWQEWCREKAIRRAFALEGYVRGVRRKKPPLSEKNQKLRLAWAKEHENWTLDQWDKIL